MSRSYLGRKFGLPENPELDPLEDLWRYLVPGSRRKESARRRRLGEARSRVSKKRASLAPRSSLRGGVPERLGASVKEWEKFQALQRQLDELLADRAGGDALVDARVGMAPIRRRQWWGDAGVKVRRMKAVLDLMRLKMGETKKRAEKGPSGRGRAFVTSETNAEAETEAVIERLRRKARQKGEKRSRAATRRVYGTRLPRGRLGGAALRYLAEQTRV